MTDPNLTLIVLVADRSGSMASIAADMNGGIRSMLAEQASQPGTCIVDIWTFDSTVEHPYDWVRPDDVKADVILPRGSTALNDATGTAIVSVGERLASLDEEDRPGKVIFVIVTDGMENSSREYSHEQVRTLVTTQTDSYGWEFLYLAANVDEFATGAQYGYSANQTLGYAATSGGAQSAVAVASAGITRSRLGGAADFTDAERQEAKQS